MPFQDIWDDWDQLMKTKQKQQQPALDKLEVESRQFPMVGFMTSKFCKCFGTDTAFSIRTVPLLLMKLLPFMYVHKHLQDLEVLGTACTA